MVRTLILSCSRSRDFSCASSRSTRDWLRTLMRGGGIHIHGAETLRGGRRGGSRRKLTEDALLVWGEGIEGIQSALKLSVVAHSVRSAVCSCVVQVFEDLSWYVAAMDAIGVREQRTMEWRKRRSRVGIEEEVEVLTSSYRSGRGLRRILPTKVLACRYSLSEHDDSPPATSCASGRIHS